MNNIATMDERIRKVAWSRKLLERPEMGAVAGALLVLIFFALMVGDSGMFSALGVANFLELSAFLGIIAVAAALLMIGGEFDLSVGSMIGFAGVAIAIPAVEWGWPLWLSIVFAFTLAIAVGSLNGVLVNKTGLPSFIITLAMLYILRGLTIACTRALTGRTQVSGLGEIVENDWLASWFRAELFVDWFDWNGLPVSVLWWIGLTLAATFILLRTQFGNWIFAVGGDKNAARNVGVPVERVKILLFIGTACAATLFATIQVLDAGSADTQRGLLKEFEAIIAAVIGGCLLTGGYGSAIGAAFGALIFGTVFAGIFYTGINTDWFRVFLGTMLIIAVLFNNFIRRRATAGK